MSSGVNRGSPSLDSPLELERGKPEERLLGAPELLLLLVLALSPAFTLSLELSSLESASRCSGTRHGSPRTSVATACF